MIESCNAARTLASVALTPTLGVLPRLVHTRFGLHIVEVMAREPGVAQPFESVRGAVEMALRQQTPDADNALRLAVLEQDVRTHIEQVSRSMAVGARRWQLKV